MASAQASPVSGTVRPRHRFSHLHCSNLPRFLGRLLGNSRECQGRETRNSCWVFRETCDCRQRSRCSAGIGADCLTLRPCCRRSNGAFCV